MAGGIAVGVEITRKKAFASALEWPGWSRAGRDEGGALAALAAYAGRYARVVHASRLALPAITRGDLDVVERSPGSAGTAFGVPEVIFHADARPTEAADGAQLAGLVRAAWTTLDEIVAATRGELRKGPRGGGRDLAAVVAHVVAAESAYARRIGIRLPEPLPTDAGAVAGVREAIADAIAMPGDGGPIPGGRWPARYAARRVAWHALDHAWEIEDRAAPW